MRRVFCLCVSLCLSALFSYGSQAAAQPPLKALLLTSPGIYHNYERQTDELTRGIAERTNIRFDVSLAEVERWKTTDFSRGYDVLIYNICMADNQDRELIANLRRQTEQLGVPAIVVHCSMHSFRETDLWWPMLGLQTKAHESLKPLTQIQAAPHPILTGIANNWTVANDELYINLNFDGQTLLSVMGEDHKPHTTAWLAHRGTTPVFGTTLGHSDETLNDPAFLRLITNAVLFVTGNLSDDGTPKPGLEPASDGTGSIETFSAAEGVKFLGEAGQDCAFREIVFAVGPCYLGCMLNPFEWGEATAACKLSCESELPTSNQIISACQPDD